MKFILIVSLIIYLVSAQPILPQDEYASVKGTEEDVLHHLAGIAVKFNATEIPGANARLPRPQLVSCVSSEQRELFRTCKSNGVTKTIESFTKGCGGKTDGNAEGMKMQMPMVMEDGAFRRQNTSAVAECILKGMKVMDIKTGQIDVIQLKEKMIYTSSLLEEQKLAAGDDLMSCIGFSQQNSKNKSAEMDDVNSMMMHQNNQSSPMQTVICVMKALIKNGCTGDVDTRSQRAALAEMAIKFAAFDETDEDSDESAASMAPNNMMARLMKKHSRERHGHRSKERPGHGHRHKSKEHHGHRSKEHGHKSKEHGHHHHHHGNKKSQEKSEEDMTSSTSSSTSTTTTTSTTTKPTTTSTTTTPSTTTSSTKKPTTTTRRSTTSKESPDKQGDQNEKEPEDE